MTVSSTITEFLLHFNAIHQMKLYSPLSMSNTHAYACYSINMASIKRDGDAFGVLILALRGGGRDLTYLPPTVYVLIHPCGNYNVPTEHVKYNEYCIVVM